VESPKAGSHSTGRAEVLLWHDNIHETQDAARLYFWRLSFSPSYERDSIIDRLRSFIGDVGVTSHTIYETLGVYDLLVRMWVPRTIDHDELELKIWRALKELKLWNISYLSCRAERHWPYSEITASVKSEDWPPLNDPVIKEVSDFNRSQASGEIRPRSRRIEDLLSQGVLRAVPMDTRGIRFFITFDHPRLPFNASNRRIAIDAIMRACDLVLSDWSARPGDATGPQISMYEGMGTMTDFLVLVQSPQTYFHEFVDDLLTHLRGAGLDGLFDMRHYTHVIADRMFKDFAEDRATPSDQLPVKIDIQSDEAESLEFKATLALNIREFLTKTNREPDPRMTHGVVRAICGLLNSPHGGTLVIGVLETRRELERAKDKAGYLAALREHFGYEAPADADLGSNLPNALIGVEAEIGDRLPFPDRDAFMNRLTEVLRSNISPNPWAFFRTEIRAIDDRHVCVVAVKPGDSWFYALALDGKHQEFFVREAGTTRAYAGTESDLFKSAHPRGLNAILR
jgi:hypothetical protein